MTDKKKASTQSQTKSKKEPLITRDAKFDQLTELVNKATEEYQQSLKS